MPPVMVIVHPAVGQSDLIVWRQRGQVPDSRSTLPHTNSLDEQGHHHVMSRTRKEVLQRHSFIWHQTEARTDEAAFGAMYGIPGFIRLNNADSLLIAPWRGRGGRKYERVRRIARSVVPERSGLAP